MLFETQVFVFEERLFLPLYVLQISDGGIGNRQLRILWAKQDPACAICDDSLKKASLTPQAERGERDQMPK